MAAETDEHLFDFRAMWKLAAFLTASVAVVPLIILAAVDYHVVRRSIEAENLFRTTRLVSLTRQTIFSHFAERRSILESKRYDLAVMDVRMPKISGLAQKKGNGKKCPGMKFIFMTGHGSEDDYKAGSAEAAYYLMKPFYIDTLIDKINEAVKQ